MNSTGGYEQNLGGTGRIRRNRDDSIKKEENNTFGKGFNN